MIFNLQDSIKEHLFINGYTAVDLQRKTKISKNQIRGILFLGATPSIENICKIASVLNTEPEMLAAEYDSSIKQLAICLYLEKMSNQQKYQILDLLNSILEDK